MVGLPPMNSLDNVLAGDYIPCKHVLFWRTPDMEHSISPDVQYVVSAGKEVSRGAPTTMPLT